MATGYTSVAGNRFIIYWDYQPATTTMDVYLVPTDPTRHIYHQTVTKDANGKDVAGYTDFRQTGPKAQAIISSLVTLGALPPTYAADALAGDTAEQRALRLSRIAALEEEAAALKLVQE